MSRPEVAAWLAGAIPSEVVRTRTYTDLSFGPGGDVEAGDLLFSTITHPSEWYPDEYVYAAVAWGYHAGSDDDNGAGLTLSFGEGLANVLTFAERNVPAELWRILPPHWGGLVNYDPGSGWVFDTVPAAGGRIWLALVGQPRHRLSRC